MKLTGIIGMMLIAVGAGADETKLPAPTGRFAVGTMTQVWSDTTRPDTISNTPERQVVVPIWYPAATYVSASRAPYVFNVSENSPDSYRSMNGSVLPNANVNVPFTTDVRRAPVIVLSTGRSTNAYDYSTLVEDLASHGYEVTVERYGPHREKQKR